MSQRGAQQMAVSIDPETGELFTGEGILKFYYPNTSWYTLEIEKIPLTPIVPPGEPEA